MNDIRIGKSILIEYVVTRVTAVHLVHIYDGGVLCEADVNLFQYGLQSRTD